MKLANTLFLSSISILGLSACGGDSNQAPQDMPAASLTVFNSANVGTVTKASYSAVTQSSEFGGVTGFFVANRSDGGVAANGGFAAASKLSQGVLAGTVVSNVPIEPTTQMCAQSGSVTVWGEIADPLTFSAGDVINVDSDNCDDGTGEVVDGLIEMTIASFSGDILTSQFLLGIDLNITDFSVSFEGRTETANGDIGATIDTRNAPAIEGSVFGDRFTVVGTEGTESLSDFSTIYTESGVDPFAWTHDAMGTVSSGDFTGAVRYDTPVIFVGEGANYPSEGELLMTGADNATLRLIALDAVNVQIDADYDGDGTIDESLFMTWDELVANAG